MVEPTVSPDGHLNDDILRACTTGKLNSAQTYEIEEHLRQCAACAARLSAVSIGTDLLGKRLDELAQSSLDSDNGALTVEQLWRVVESEITTRRKSGQPVDPQAYLQRFPELQLQLTQCFQDVTLLNSDVQKSESNPTSGFGRVELPGRKKELSTGDQIGHYDIQSVLGRGGMGVVFKARHRETGQVVALKTISGRSGVNDELLRRFRREAKTAARLSHPNIVSAVEADEASGVPFIALEYVPGANLADVVRGSEPLAIPRVIDYIRQAARGLGYAHEQGVIHRDVKPSNMLLHEETQQVKLLDLGLARVKHSQRPRYLKSQLVGLRR